MNIYVAHASSFDFRSELYKPLRDSNFATNHNLVFPHESSNEPYDSKSFFKDSCDLVIAEVSFSSTGLGIELGWASLLGIRIIAVYRSGQKISSSIKAVTDEFIEYSSTEELVSSLEKALR